MLQYIYIYMYIYIYVQNLTILNKNPKHLTRAANKNKLTGNIKHSTLKTTNINKKLLLIKGY